MHLLSVSLFPLWANGIEQVGFRLGIDADADTDLTSYEIYGVAETPWSWEFSNGYELNVEFELMGGVLDGEDTTGGFFKIAPQLRLQSQSFPLELVVSSGPSYLTEKHYGDLDFGGHFQFTSAAGLDWQLNEDWTLGYRYQHTSNAGIYDVNDGFNLHSFALAYNF
ncbi:acyloxyacyl hydrolase [Coraliomargarita sp. W4R53]